MMPRIAAETAQERRVWELLTRDFYWDVPKQHPVQIYDGSNQHSGPARLQIFEMAITTILAYLRPEFAWRVTQNRPDSGLDFIGVYRFLDDGELGIAAAITVGGQCKKRSTVNDVLSEIAGSLIRMADAINPTFFVVALSARLTRQRIESARGMLERQCQRHCHILDRAQIEGLISDHLGAVVEILQEGLTKAEFDEVRRYFESRLALPSVTSVSVTVPPRVLAGAPFNVEVIVRSTLVSNPEARLWWRPPNAADVGAITLIGPVGAESRTGLALISRAPSDDPLHTLCTLELMTYTVGHVDLGDILVGLGEAGADSAERIVLGGVDVIENMRPRFFDRPFRSGLARLSQSYDQALAGIITSVGVVGAGGSGKSRMCEEFALEKRRRGCDVIAAKQTKTHDAPHRILADLMVGLVADELTLGDMAESVIRAIASYDRSLAERATPSIRSIFGSGGQASSDVTEQSVLSALLLLIVARSRSTPLIVHLQDLHWCGADVLLLLERLVWQLNQFVSVRSAALQQATNGVLFIFEGRVRESGDSSADIWSSVPFEAFLQRIDSPTVMCSSFTKEEGLAFVRLLFEDRHNAHRLVADDLLTLQHELIDRIHGAAGGNPFHSLEHLRLLKELRVLGQNPKTGLLYMIRPEPVESVLPDSVFGAVQLRWQYLRSRMPALALLLWASALLEDQLAAQLFQRLWRELAPAVSLRDVDGTDMLWTGDGQAREIGFRHENYFESLRRFTVPEEDRRRVVDIYCRWFAERRRPSPADRFRWARALLELPDPDVRRVRALLSTALKGARKQGDLRLARRIRAFNLDLIWSNDEQSPLPTNILARHCDDEIDLSREFLGIDRDQAARRLQRLRRRIEVRLSTAVGVSPRALEELQRRHLLAEAIHAQLLFNDRRPAQSAEIAGRVVERIREYRLSSDADVIAWDSLEMEALYTFSCAQAISGEYPPAVLTSEAAAAIAKRSPSPLARKVISTYGSILLSEDVDGGEALLRGCVATGPEDETSDAFLVHVHLSMALILRAYRRTTEPEQKRLLLDEACERTSHVFYSCRRLGLFPDAGAAAIVRGIASAMSGENDEVSWFAQGVAAAAKGRQMEVLWRSHINLAIALYRRVGDVTQSARDHAFAALEIMEDTLSSYSQPDRSPRFEMLRVGMARAAWILLSTGDDAGSAVLERYPRLRSHFSDPEAGVLAEYHGDVRHYQWLRVDGVDYVLY